MYDLPGQTAAADVVIDCEMVRRNVNPTLVPRIESEDTRSRRAS